MARTNKERFVNISLFNTTSITFHRTDDGSSVFRNLYEIPSYFVCFGHSVTASQVLFEQNVSVTAQTQGHMCTYFKTWFLTWHVLEPLLLLRSGSSQSFTLWKQATIEITRRDRSITACPRHIHIYGCYPSGTSHSWWIAHLTLRLPIGCNQNLRKKAFHRGAFHLKIDKNSTDSYCFVFPFGGLSLPKPLAVTGLVATLASFEHSNATDFNEPAQVTETAMLETTFSQITCCPRGFFLSGALQPIPQVGADFT